MFWYDGQLIQAQKIQLPIDEPGLCYGATAFTTVRVYEQTLEHPQTYWLAHCDRLKSAVASFRWQQPNWKRLRQGAEIMLKSFPILRVAIFPRGQEWITGRSLPPNLTQLQSHGIKAWVNNHPQYSRELAQFKTGNYLAAYLARQQALAQGAQEAILIDLQGNWLETSTGNLWGWKENCWYTPSLESPILPGIARQRWLDFFHVQQIPVVETRWSPKFVSTLSALCYSNCVIDLVPITTILTAKTQTNYIIRLPKSDIS